MLADLRREMALFVREARLIIANIIAFLTHPINILTISFYAVFSDRLLNEAWLKYLKLIEKYFLYYHNERVNFISDIQNEEIKHLNDNELIQLYSNQILEALADSKRNPWHSVAL